MTQWGLDTLFNPAKRHMDEEKRRLQSTREEVGDNSGGKRIDLESGKVHIRRSTTDDDATDHDATDHDAKDDASAEPDGKSNGKPGRKPAAKSGSKPDGKSNGKPAAESDRKTGGKPGAKSDGKPGRRSAARPSADRGEPSPAAVRAAQRRGREPR